jgi:CDP-diacylglycerol--glycerol-3-phosphate 3-phosphatidyltransferase
MNLPNKLTVARVVMIPVFAALFLLDSIPYNYAFALVVFAVAAYTDHLDGKIARERGLITNFGKMMDPLADKMLVMSAMILFIPVGMAHAVAVIVILIREFLVTAIRTIAAADGIALAADIWGKWKTVSQIVWVIAGLLLLFVKDSLGFVPPDGITILYNCIIGIVVALTLFSGFNYTWKNRTLFKDM